MTVLIVDDEADIRETLQELFEDEGYEVRTAANGADALRLLDGPSLPCVVVLDMIMPVMTGNEMYARMQGDPRLAKIPVIISTSDPSRAPAGTPVMKKPVDFDRLLGVIKRHCGEPGARRD